MNAKKSFEILGIPPTKDEKLIKKAYHKLALKYHPDRNSSQIATEKFIQVNEAYEYLSNGLQEINHTLKSPTNESPHRRRKEQTTEERWEAAKMNYERQRQKEFLENERHYQRITSGKTWKYFKVVMFSSIFLAVIFSLDTFFLPYQTSTVYIANRNVDQQYKTLTGKEVYPILLTNHKLVYFPSDFLFEYNGGPIKVQTSLIFKNITAIAFWNKTHWVQVRPGFTFYRLFYLVLFLLIFPLITYFFKSKTAIFTLFFNLSIYLVPLLIIIILLFHNRFIHLITLGIY